MRALILALSVLGIFVGADAAKAGPSTTARDPSVEPATFTDEATQESEDRVGLDKRMRRDVQRRLTGLGFDTRVNGRFDGSTRAAITSWQGARDYPKTGFLNPPQYQALQGRNPSRRRRQASGPATPPMTTIRPVAAAGTVTITAMAALAAQLA